VASEREITLGDVWRAIWRGKWIVVGTTVLAALIAFAFTFTADTTYTASAKVYLGQATTMMGNLASTPGTNPLTAATMLQGDAVVAAVAKETGLTPSTVRARTDIAVPRAPGTVTTNQPAIATITATTAEREGAITLANAYAKAALAGASGGYDAVSTTLERQVRQLRAEEIRLAAATRRQPTNDLLTQLNDVREVLTTSELQLARARSSGSSSASSSRWPSAAASAASPAPRSRAAPA